MTKILTEQFLYGQLLDGYWYIDNDGHEDILEVEKGKYYLGGVLVARAFMGDKIDKIEVVAPVPSYDEWQESQKKRALWFDKYKTETYKLEQKIQELENQIKEANNLFLQIQNKLENEPEEKTMTETRIYKSIDVYLTKWVGKDWWMKNE